MKGVVKVRVTLWAAFARAVLASPRVTWRLVVLELDRVAKGEEAVVDARGALGAGLLDVADGLELLPGDLDGLLGLLQDLGRLGNQQADGVANAAGDVALGDHDVPVLDEVAHLVVGHVGGREHADDALHGAGLG